MIKCIWKQYLDNVGTKQVKKSPLAFSLEQVSKWNPLVNAIVSINPCLSDTAATSDNIDADIISELSGIPIFIKDSILTSNWMTTSASTSVIMHWIKDNKLANQDAPIIQQLKKSGAVLVAKTTCPELCADIQTWSSLFGTTKNPYDLTLTSGGSSGGSAVAVSVGMAPLALGSDMAGSLRIPSAFCGVYSLRPTCLNISQIESIDQWNSNLVNYRGHVPPAPFTTPVCSNLHYECPLSVIGPIGNSIDMLKRFISATTSQKSVNIDKKIHAAITLTFPTISEIDYRIEEAITKSFTQEYLSQADIACTQIRLPSQELDLDFVNLRSAYIQLTQPLTDAVMKLMGQDIPVDSERSKKQMAAEQIQRQQQEIFDQFLTEYDCWIIPVTPVLPFPHNQTQSPIPYLIKTEEGIVVKKHMAYWKSIAFATPISVLGNPVVTLPFAMVSIREGVSVPVALQIVGRRNREQELLSICERFESLFANCIQEPDILRALGTHTKL